MRLEPTGVPKIYAIADATLAVQVFDTDGNWEATIGREGEGPGEFERPYSLAVTRASAVRWRQRNSGRVVANSL